MGIEVSHGKVDRSRCTADEPPILLPHGLPAVLGAAFQEPQRSGLCLRSRLLMARQQCRLEQGPVSPQPHAVEGAPEPPHDVTATLTYTMNNGNVDTERTAFHLVRRHGMLKIARSTVLSSGG